MFWPAFPLYKLEMESEIKNWNQRDLQQMLKAHYHSGINRHLVCVSRAIYLFMARTWPFLSAGLLFYVWQFRQKGSLATRMVQQLKITLKFEGNLPQIMLQIKQRVCRSRDMDALRVQVWKVSGIVFIICVHKYLHRIFGGVDTLNLSIHWTTPV